MIRRFILLIWLCLFSSVVYADELKPAYIELNQISVTQWKVLWKASTASPLANANIILPKNCMGADEAKKKFVNNNQITIFTMTCKGKVYGQNIGLQGLEFSNSDALVRIAAIDHDVQTIRLTPDENHKAISPPDIDNIITNVAKAYTILGFEHILEGYDHVLFVLALVLLIPNLRRATITVTAFTIAHSITLIGTTLGYLSLPPQPVEAVIALSIIFLALEIIASINIKKQDLRLSQRYPWVVAFLFGLLHGFGFAGALAEIGLPKNDIALALLTFNIGVELGQLLIIFTAIALLRLIGHFKPRFIKALKIMLSYAIGTIATYWFIERMIG